ncbi:hypothetical protein E0Z10_g3048 [Xylaria hypoxylon]|uniref:Alanine--tRNA ligase n=1 Tax=Xylaria hypoxylon TaxID=37992 RepID=A0A4Z0Z1U8_9PEZI|nr:hypothetical protein E0Z10_g3048 [Xylaria hypoxylon]
MRLLLRQRRGGHTPIIGSLSHSSRRFYTGGPPAAHADATISLPPTVGAAALLAPLPLITFKCPAPTLLDTKRIASDILPPPLLRRRYHTTVSHALAPQPRNSRLRSFRPSPRSPFSPHDLHARLSLHKTLSTMAETEWTGVRVRNTFFDYFAKKGHAIVPSSSVVPHNDPTLLFTNAGMNQFKPIFLGTIAATDDLAKLKRAVDTQKCIRAGGKHNDLDDVGKDSYHHTFFEMLGNWSFGDYFKKEAVEWSWELLTKVFGLDPARLYVTYFEGSPEMNLEPDLEAKELWKSVGVPEDHILPGNMKDNFWEMGATGPCGPCSEIHYDKIGGGRNAAHLVNADDPMVVEVWNNVFMQFDRQEDKSLKTLPAKHIDTGMGFERLVSALQNKDSNYATDIFTPLFDKIQEVTGARPYTDKYGKDDVDGIDTAYRVVADHIRLLTFAISDGAAPNNEGRGYVVRRVLRRGVRYARKYFNAEIGSFFSQILPALVEQMGEQFPEIVKKQQDVKELLDEEEEAGSKKLSGADVWRLYDTFGFPEDLTKLMAEERGLSMDEKEIAEAREKAREASKAVKESSQTFAKLNVHQLAELKDQLQLPLPDDEPKFFKGNTTGRVQRIYTGTGFLKSTKDLPPNTPFGLLLNRTNFYAEQGGQVADEGRILIDDVAEFEVHDVQQFGGYIVHNGYLKYGELKAGDEVICEYDELRRQPIRNNHTATHILNHSLREVLGDDVNQKGSLVDQDKLRYDFSHKVGVTIPELQKIESSSNDYIRQNCKIYSKDVELDLAKKISGVRAVFGETYPNPVRVVSVGIDVDTLLETPENPEWRKVSVEFCGGTHVDKTGLIKDLVIVEESGIAKGIRRIVAYTGEAAHRVQREAAEFSKRIDIIGALHFTPEKEAEVKQATVELNNLVISTLQKEELKTRFAKIVKSVVDEQKKRQKAESKTALDTVTGYFAKDENKDAKHFIAHLPISANAKAVSDVMTHFKSKDKERTVYVFGGSKAEGAVVHGLYVGTYLASKGVTAETWASAVTDIIGGKSGGKEPTRQGQGTNPDKIEEAVAVAEKWLAEKLKISE